MNLLGQMVYNPSSLEPKGIRALLLAFLASQPS